MKHFIKAGNKIYTLGTDGKLFAPSVSEIPNQGEFYEYGMDDLSGIFTPLSKIYLSMDRINELGEGMAYTIKLTPLEFSRKIKRIRNYNEGVV